MKNPKSEKTLFETFNTFKCLHFGDNHILQIKRKDLWTATEEYDYGEPERGMLLKLGLSWKSLENCLLSLYPYATF